MKSEIMKNDLVLQNINTGQKFILERNKSTYSCGRSQSNDIVSQSILASREHCLFIRSNAGLNVIDMGSSNGVHVNGVKLATRVMTLIAINDVIGIGCSFVQPTNTNDSRAPTVFKLMLHETNDDTASSKLKEEASDAKVNSASHNKRKHSSDSPDLSVPLKVPKLEVAKSTVDIIDISDESDHEAAQTTEKKIITSHNENRSTEEIKRPKSNSNISDKIDENDEEKIHKKLHAPPRFPEGTNSSKSTNSHEESEKKIKIVASEVTKRSNDVPRSSTNHNRQKNSPKSTISNKHVVPQKMENNTSESSLSEETRNSTITLHRSDVNEEIPKNVDEDVDFLVPAFDMEELDSHETDKRKIDEIVLPNGSTLKRIQLNETNDQLIKYEPEINIIDDDESIYKNGNASNVVAPTPIKLVRVKQEPKTRYSEFDVVVLSDDEDGVFPASQLFGDESSDEVDDASHGVVIKKDEEIDDNYLEIFQDRRNDIAETIVLSDSDADSDDDNPWYDRLLRSQLLNESRLSQNNDENVKVETENNVPCTADDDAKPFEEEQDELVEENNKDVPIEDVPVEDVPVEDVPFEDVPFEDIPIEDVPIDDLPVKDVTNEIYDLCFSNEADRPKKHRQKRDRNHKREVQAKNDNESVVNGASRGEKINDRHSSTTSKTSKKKHSSKVVCRDDKLSNESDDSIDEKTVANEKKSPRKKLSKHKKMVTEKPTEQSEATVEKSSSTEKRSRKTEKSMERAVVSNVDVVAKDSKPERDRTKHDVKSTRTPDSSNDKPVDIVKSKKSSPSTSTADARCILDKVPKPIVMLTKIDHVAKTVTESKEHDEKSPDKRKSPAKRLIIMNDDEQVPARKLTGKEKKELIRRSKIEEKIRAKEQRHRRVKNKWAAECLPLKKKPVASPLSREKRLEIANDRKEKLRQIAVEKKMSEDGESSSTMRRIVVKPKAKVTTNTRNDFLVQELVDREPKQDCPNVEEIVKENATDDSNEKANEPSENVKGGKDAEKNVLRINECNVWKEMNNENIVTKRIPKKPKSAILIEQSDIPIKISEKPSTSDSSKTHGHQTRKVVQNGIIRDPRTEKTSSKSRKSILKENREPEANGEPGPSRRIKRVTFDDLNTRVDLFEIEPGNTLNKCVSKDAPLLVKKTITRNAMDVKNSCPKLEQFLLLILKWNPVWLQEQKILDTTPPVVDEKKLVPLLSKYSTFDDYYNVAEPLLALELWYGISRDYEVGKATQQSCFTVSIVNHSVVLTTVPGTKLRSTTLMLELVVSKRQAQTNAHPVYGDLVFFEYNVHKKSTSGQHIWKVFAYVTGVRQTLITPTTHFNRDLLTYAKDPHALLTYTVMTKSLDPTTVQTNKVSRLRTITYLRSNIRMIQALQSLPISPLCDAILHPKIEDYQLPSVMSNLEDYPLVTNDKLNAKQLEAVVRVTEAVVQRLPKLCLIQGPPGTGKSRVIVNLVAQILYGNNRYQSNKKMRILVCAPSNAAIDELVLRLLDLRKTFQKGNRFNMVRMGRNESMHPQVKDVSITELAIKDVKKTADAYMSPNFTNESVEEEKRYLQARVNSLNLEKANTTTQQSPMQSNRIQRKLADVQAKLDLLMNRRSADRLDTKEMSRLQRAAENTLLKGADVIACTLTSCFTNHMEAIFTGKHSISVCIVDEATQSSEAETLIPLMLGVRTLVLVGDTNQLPATIISQKAKKMGLDQSLFARVQRAFDGEKNSPIITLDTQYRMSFPVAYWPNRYFYHGALRNAADKYSLPFHCYKIMNLDSIQDNDKFSNAHEATFVANVVYTLMTRSNVDDHVGPVRIGIITPYNNQKHLVVQKIRERIVHVSDKIKKKFVHEVKTIDSFQGQERDVVIISCVRSSGIGFLSDRQRLCVALTRAKHSMMLCGNFKTFEKDPMWNALLTDGRSRGVFVNIKANANIDEIKRLIIR